MLVLSLSIWCGAGMKVEECAGGRPEGEGEQLSAAVEHDARAESDLQVLQDLCNNSKKIFHRTLYNLRLSSRQKITLLLICVCVSVIICVSLQFYTPI